MGIEIIGKLTQKNNGDFKLVDLEDVDYDGTGKSAKQELEKKIEEAKNSSTPYDDSVIKADIQTLKDNEVTLVKDGTSMEGIKDNEYDTLNTTDKTIVGAINEVNAQFKDIAKEKADKNDVRMKNVSITPEDTTFARIVEGEGGTVNLYDKNNSNDKNLTISSNLTNITSASTLTSFVLPIKPNTVYTLEKVLSNRFWYATTTDEPDVNVAINSQANIVNKTKYTFTSTGNDNYLLVVYYKTDDTLTKEEIMDSIKVYEGTEYIEGTNKKIKIDNLKIDEVDATNVLIETLMSTLAYKPLGVLQKGYICLIADDGNLRLIDTTLPILEDKNVPFTLALMQESPIFNDVNSNTYKTQIKNLVDNGKCSVCHHGGKLYTEYTKEQLINFFKSEKEFFNSFGIKPVGCCFPNHACNESVKAIAGTITGVCCGGNDNKYYPKQLNGARSNLYHLTRTSLVSFGLDNLKEAVNLAISNKQLLIVFWHDISLYNEISYQQILKDFLDYAKGTDIEFITLDKLINMI